MKAGSVRKVLAKGSHGGNRAQCSRSIFCSVFHDGCSVRKWYLSPTISPSKKVVSVGWSSVRPVAHGQQVARRRQSAFYLPCIRR